MHDSCPVEVLSGAVEMLSEAMAEGAHSSVAYRGLRCARCSRAQSWMSTASVRRPRTRFAHAAAAASFRSAAGFLPFATSPMTAARSIPPVIRTSVMLGFFARRKRASM